MRALALFVLSISTNLAGALTTDGTRSRGCVSGALGAGRRMRRSVTAPGNSSANTVQRDFFVTAPPNKEKKALPVLLNFHGWGNDWKEIADEHSFDDLAEEKGFVVVYAQGMSDHKKNASWGSWNLGQLSDDMCDHSEASKWNACYDSCGSSCNVCSWTTCVNDVAYTDAMVQSLSEDACLDMSRLYAYGESNGGMFVYKLLKERPGMFAAAAPEQGLPPSADGSTDLAPTHTALLHLHDRGDTAVPIDGKLSSDGWRYASLDTTMRSVCGSEQKADVTSNSTGGPLEFRCKERLGCTAPQVVSCAYNGQHGDLPKVGAKGMSGDRFIWDFLQKHRNPAPWNADAPGFGGTAPLMAEKVIRPVV